ncbi:hypothetical protein MACH15_19150 [Maricaulis maris]|nr:hypothetical protein MACH15_19150 [Maricaulis maris]
MTEIATQTDKASPNRSNIQSHGRNIGSSTTPLLRLAKQGAKAKRDALHNNPDQAGPRPDKAREAAKRWSG